MRDWLSLYRTGGFEALYPKTRSDHGLPRRLPSEVAEVLVPLKSEQPALSAKSLVGAARERGVDHPSTVHRRSDRLRFPLYCSNVTTASAPPLGQILSVRVSSEHFRSVSEYGT